MMHCPSCGDEVGDKDQFCRQCGGRLRGTGTVPPAVRPDDPTMYMGGRRSPRVALAVAGYIALAIVSGVVVYMVLNRGPKTGSITLGTPRLLVMTPARTGPGVAPDGAVKTPTPPGRRRTGTPSRKSTARPPVKPPGKKGEPTKPPVEPPITKPVTKPPVTKPPVTKPPVTKPPTKTPPEKPGKAKPQDAEDAIDRYRAGLNAESVRMVMRHHMPQIRACYDRALKQKPDLAGIVEIRFTISEKGRVSAASVHRNTSGHDGLGKCLAITIKRWRFPKPVGGAMEFVYPFVFASSD